jgi:hypothetical protein
LISIRSSSSLGELDSIKDGLISGFTGTGWGSSKSYSVSSCCSVHSVLTTT